MKKKSAKSKHRLTSLEDFNVFREESIKIANKDKNEIVVCHGTGCLANGSIAVTDALKRSIISNKIDAKIIPKIKTTGCNGFCSRGPLITVNPDGFFYQRVTEKDIDEIVEKTIINHEPVEHLLYRNSVTSEQVFTESEIPFYKFQERLVLNNIGKIDPCKIEDSIARNGYQALLKVILNMTPEEVINEVENSGLRGRGGAGFPTGVKWRSAYNAMKNKGGPVYVVVNGDEGDPGAFMDRTIMEGDPHAVLEGLIIGAFALGAKNGYLYVRAEYPLAIHNLEIAMKQLRELGLLGENIFNTGFSFDIKINQGAGAFVCGESTALFASIEGKAGNPRPKYVRSVEQGLWGKPTVLNNVETWANIPLIIRNGASWFSEIGTKNNTGTKVFSLVGKINNVGLVEVPMGTKLEYIVEKIGGGLPNGEPFKAVQTGGPSGGCIPNSLKDIRVDFDSLSDVGSMMGSGGMIVMDKDDCVVDISRYFLKFLEEESCGKCLPCRLGLVRLRKILDSFSRGKGEKKDLDDIENISKAIMDSSLCALGSSAPNPVLTTLKYFKDEYLKHIEKQKCDAGVCKELIRYAIDKNKCTGCRSCARQCPESCISGSKKKVHLIDSQKCIKCGMCKDICKFDAVFVE